METFNNLVTNKFEFAGKTTVQQMKENQIDKMVLKAYENQAQMVGNWCLSVVD